MSEETDSVVCFNQRLSVQLPPIALADIRAALLRNLRRRLGRFDSGLDGIILDYKNVMILNDLGMIKNDIADIFIDVQLDFYVFQPKVGDKLRGTVNKKCSTHLSVLVHKIFNVVIPRPDDCYKWVGEKLNVGQNIFFTIVVLDLHGTLPYIRGELDENFLDGNLPAESKKFETMSLKISPPLVDFDGTKPRIVDVVEENIHSDDTHAKKENNRINNTENNTVETKKRKNTNKSDNSKSINFKEENSYVNKTEENEVKTKKRKRVSISNDIKSIDFEEENSYVNKTEENEVKTKKRKRISVSNDIKSIDFKEENSHINKTEDNEVKTKKRKRVSISNDIKSIDFFQSDPIDSSTPLIKRIKAVRDSSDLSDTNVIIDDKFVTKRKKRKFESFNESKDVKSPKNSSLDKTQDNSEVNGNKQNKRMTVSLRNDSDSSSSDDDFDRKKCDIINKILKMKSKSK